jgi:hypothetical protein
LLDKRQPFESLKDSLKGGPLLAVDRAHTGERWLLNMGNMSFLGRFSGLREIAKVEWNDCGKNHLNININLLPRQFVF